MRYLGLVLILLLPVPRSAEAANFFADFLYWQTTEPVDWVLETNRLPVNQYVTYRTLEYDFAPGLRIGVGTDGEEWDTKFWYTHYDTSTSDSATGDLTTAFLGGKQAQPPAPVYYFDSGQVSSSINYNLFDWDLSKRFQPSPALEVRPLVGLRGGWINQSIDSAFQADYSLLGIPVAQRIAESMKNDFWGIGPKFGLENSLVVRRREESELRCFANFYTSFLAGQWTIDDVTDLSTTALGLTINTRKTIAVPDRNFGALAFQAIIGFNWRYRRWSATAGYEVNDWLNQCQIFDDATGPHNNDLILQGLTANLSWRF